MKKTLYILFAICLPGLYAQLRAQPACEWAKSFITHSGSQTAFTTQQAVDLNGNVYTTGYFSGSYDFDPGPDTFLLSSTAVINIYIVKLDSAGNFLWAKTLANDEKAATNYAIGAPLAVDLAGNVYVTGFFKGTTDFDPGPGNYDVTSTGSRTDIFILKLDTDGNFKWVRTMGSGVFNIGTNAPGCISIDNSGSMYITGAFSDTVDFDGGPEVHELSAAGFYDVFVLKMDLDGNFIWVKDIGGANCQNYAHSIVASEGGGVYLCGVFTETVDFNPGPGVMNITATSGHYDTFMLKLDAEGNFTWVKRLGGGGSVFGYALALDAQENVYMAGAYSNAVDFDPGPATYNMNGGRVYILKLSVEGNFIWARSLNGGAIFAPHTLAIAPSGNVYLAGIFAGPTDFDPGPDTLIMNSIGFTPGALHNNSDFFLLSLNAMGVLRSVSIIGESGDDNCSSIVVKDDEHIYLTGNYGGTIDIDPGDGVCQLPMHNASIQNSDVFIAKWRLPQVRIVGPGMDDVSIYPNPTKNFVTLDFGEKTGDVLVEICSVDGRLMQRKQYSQVDTLTLLLDASPGVYFIRLKRDNRITSVYKVVKE